MNKLAKADPVTGPLTREEFQALVDAPFGKAVEKIREFDPQFGRQPGEKFKWKVRAQSTMRGTAYVMAADEKEADKEADALNDAAFDWNDYGDDFEILSVEPDIRKR